MVSINGDANDLIFAAYGGMISILLVVIITYTGYLKRNWSGLKSLKDPKFEIGLGIWGIAMSAFIIRTYFQGWKTGEILGFSTAWMLSHISVVYIIAFPCICYCWHIRSATRHEYGEKFWILSALFTLFCTYTTYQFSQHHEWAKDLAQWITN